ncbi:MAG: permease prefix domain 1-containing protein [Acidobacteriota bacterium]
MFWKRRRRDADFSREIQAHIALEMDRLAAEGRSPEDARAAAIRRFGNDSSRRARPRSCFLVCDSQFCDSRIRRVLSPQCSGKSGRLIPASRSPECVPCKQS